MKYDPPYKMKYEDVQVGDLIYVTGYKFRDMYIKDETILKVLEKCEGEESFRIAYYIEGCDFIYPHAIIGRKATWYDRLRMWWRWWRHGYNM